MALATPLRSTAAGSLTLDDTSSISGGTVTVAASTGKLTLNGTSGISGGELNNAGTVTTTGTDTIGTETITSSDAINVTGGTLTLDATTVPNNGAVTVSDGAALVAKNGTTITNGAMATRLRSTARAR